MTHMAHENKTMKIAKLSEQGLSTREIAEIVQSTQKSVSVTLCRIRRGGGRSANGAMVIDVDPAIRGKLIKEARRREMREQDLAAMIITAVVRDGIINAVVDDDGPDT